MGGGYPYGGGEFSNNDTSTADFRALDTNKNGRLDEGDDPFSPYYPGDNYVDWVGLSTYHFGLVFPWTKNDLPQPTKFVDLVTGTNGNGNYTADKGGINFYNLYSAAKGKPFMITESGASYHTKLLATGAALPPGPGEMPIKKAFWNQYLTNPAIQSQFPLLKGICLFEFIKDEELTERDFFITKPGIVEEFKKDFAAVAGKYALADPNIAGSPSFPGAASANSFPLILTCATLLLLGLIL
jgi:hypothetical protein